MDGRWIQSSLFEFNSEFSEIFSLITFRVSRRRREMYIGHARLCVCLCVCVTVPRPMSTLLHGPGCNLGGMVGVPPSCALVGGFAVGARVSLL